MKTLVDVMSGQTAAAQEDIVFDEAFTLHNRTVFRAACAIVHDAGLAEDITQETFIKLYHNMESITDEEMLKPWLIRVALNLAKNTIRGNSRANAREESYVKLHGDREEFTAEKEYEQSETAKEVNLALDKIKEPLRSCLILKQQGLSYKEIADSLSLKETSVGTYIARGKREFVRFYGKIGGVS
ncbi:MAG: sigma-70 family RNA polymerase sigma factor [Pyrinomonadaceae bacterium]|nr:sigma-70 family RNA polymerase sigma factor [Pyrinomonadaceae bacterium]